MISITEFLSNSLSILVMYAPRMDDYIDFTGSNKAILSSRKEMTPQQYMSEVTQFKFLFNKRKGKGKRGEHYYVYSILNMILSYRSNKRWLISKW